MNKLPKYEYLSLISKNFSSLIESGKYDETSIDLDKIKVYIYLEAIKLENLPYKELITNVEVKDIIICGNNLIIPKELFLKLHTYNIEKFIKENGKTYEKSPFNYLYTKPFDISNFNGCNYSTIFCSLNEMSIQKWYQNKKSEGLNALITMLKLCEDPYFKNVFLQNYDMINNNMKFYGATYSLYYENILSVRSSLKNLDPMSCLHLFRNKLTFIYPTSYIVHLKHRTDRYEHFSTQLNRMNLEYEVVHAVEKGSDLLNYLTLNCEHLNHNPYGNDRMAEFSCLASHIKAIKTFVEKDPNKYGIILEDDVAFHKDYLVYLKCLLGTLKNESLVMFLVTDTNMNNYARNEYPHILNKGELYLLNIDKNKSWGAVGYIISKDYAKKVLELYDKPFRLIESNLRNRVVSEMITMNSGGKFTYPHLVLEWKSPSNINPRRHEYHQSIFMHLNPDAYI
jgi:GR25 family glycosyltransferase involved in LPS biosynthesis